MKNFLVVGHRGRLSLLRNGRVGWREGDETVCRGGWELSSGHKRLLKTSGGRVGERLLFKGEKNTHEKRIFFFKPEYSPSKNSFPKAKPGYRFGEGVVGIRQPGG